MVMVTWLAFTPSCQPHHDVNLRIKFLGSATVPERGNLHGCFHTLGREILGFTGMVPPGVAEVVGSLFPRVPASMCEGFRQKVHRTLARARFALEHVKNWGGLGALLEGLTHGFIASLLYKFMDALIHWLIDSLIQLIDPLLHWFITVHWLVWQNLTLDSLFRCFTVLSIHWFIDSLTHCFFNIHWIIGSLNLRLIASLLHWLIDSLVHWCIESLNHRFMDSVIDCFIVSLNHWLIGSWTHLLLHWPIDSLIGTVIRWLLDLLFQGFVDLSNHWSSDSVFMHSLIES